MINFVKENSSVQMMLRWSSQSYSSSKLLLKLKPLINADTDVLHSWRRRDNWIIDLDL